MLSMVDSRETWEYNQACGLQASLEEPVLETISTEVCSLGSSGKWSKQSLWLIKVRASLTSLLCAFILSIVDIQHKI